MHITEDEELWFQEISNVKPLTSNKSKISAGIVNNIIHHNSHKTTIVKATIVADAVGVASSNAIKQNSNHDCHNTNNNFFSDVFKHAPENIIDAGFIIKIGTGGNAKQQQAMRKMTNSTNAKIKEEYLDLDLHGLTIDQTAYAMQELLQEAHDFDIRYLRIIHGKSSKNGKAILKSYVNYWLMHLKCVLMAYSIIDSSRQSGAVLVLLKKSFFN